MTAKAERMDMRRMLRLEEHGPDTYVGLGPVYPWGGLYGGQIVAQALRAAARTVEDRFRVHSLHAFFIRQGDAAEPIRFEVDRLRNGRSFVTRAVVARQAVGAILNLSASFQADEDAPDVQLAAPPEAAAPDGVANTSWTDLFDRRWARPRERGRATAWLRLAEGEQLTSPIEHACALAYLTDDLPTDAVVRLHPEIDAGDESWMSASLDHAIWFHRPPRADDWTLQDFRCHGLLSSRGLATGDVFAADGVHIATVAQEVLLRHRPRERS